MYDKLIINMTTITIFFVLLTFGISQDSELCGMEFYNNPQSRNCDLLGPPDFPEIRNNYLPNKNTPIKTINLIIHTFADDNGLNFPISHAEFDAQMLTLNEMFLHYRIQFNASFIINNHGLIHSEGVDVMYYSMIDDCPEWYADGVLPDVVNQFAIIPEENINIYVVNIPYIDATQCGEDVHGIVEGVATFPWEENILTAEGEIFINVNDFGGDQTIIAHELGHTLGLWHTYKGIESVEECGPCYEFGFRKNCSW